MITFNDLPTPFQTEVMLSCHLKDATQLSQTNRELNRIFRDYIHTISESWKRAPIAPDVAVQVPTPSQLKCILLAGSRFSKMVASERNLTQLKAFMTPHGESGCSDFELVYLGLSTIQSYLMYLSSITEDSEEAEDTRRLTLGITEEIISLSREVQASGNMELMKALFLRIKPYVPYLTYPSLRHPGTGLPPELKALTGLRQLELESPRAPGAPDAMQLFTSPCETLTQEITSFSRLNHLQLNYHAFREFPSVLAELPALTNLELSYNLLTQIPEGPVLASLQTLDLSGNAISAFPVHIVARMPRLQNLQLRDNGLSNVPPDIGDLTELQTLDLSKNQVKELPKELSRCAELKSLNLDENPLEQIPLQLRGLNLDTLSIFGKEVRTQILISTIIQIMSLPVPCLERDLLLAMDSLNVLVSADIRRDLMERYNVHFGGTLSSTWEGASEEPKEINKRDLIINLCEGWDEHHPLPATVIDPILVGTGSDDES